MSHHPKTVPEPVRSRSRSILRYVVVKHLRSEKYAWRGLYEIIHQQLNFKIELLASIIVGFTGWLVHISTTEWLILAFTVVLVLISEAFNSVVEAMCDALSKEYNENIRYAKDVAAGAVLLSALLSVLVGMIIFVPYLIKLWP